jgi:hypothetical protein
MQNSIEDTGSAIVFAGTKAVDVFQYKVIAGALDLYAKTGMKVARNYTPTAMLAKANELTGLTFKRGQYALAAEALRKAADKIRSEF